MRHLLLYFLSRLSLLLMLAAVVALLVVAGLGFALAATPDALQLDGALDLFFFFVLASSVMRFLPALLLNAGVTLVWGLILPASERNHLFFLCAGLAMVAFARGAVDFYAKHRFGVATLMVNEVQRNEKLLKRMLPEAMVEQMLTVNSAVGRRREPLRVRGGGQLYGGGSVLALRAHEDLLRGDGGGGGLRGRDSACPRPPLGRAPGGRARSRGSRGTSTRAVWSAEVVVVEE
jgi:hypothetical protein